MKVVAITGCNGFIGKQLTRFLLEKGVVVIGLDISEPSIEKTASFSFFKMDFSPLLRDVLSKYKIDVLYHLAWCGVSTDDKDDYKKQFENFGITYRTLLLAKDLGIKKVVIPGSMSEFSECSSPVTGYEVESPSDLYAATKIAIRKIAYQFCRKNEISLNWLLVTSVYSNYRKDSHLIGYVINELKNDRPIKTTPLEQAWDYLGVEDLLNAMFLVGENGVPNEIYPVGSGEMHQLAYYVRYIARKMEKESLVKVGALAYKNSFIDNSVPDITKLRGLGFVPRCSFEKYIDSIL